jgi:rhamnogalacturonan endolyase
VIGQLIVNEPLRPGVSSAGAYVGLAQPEPQGNWQFESKRYQFWTRADASGNFTIPDVRQGTYTLYAFTRGAVGEYARPEVVAVTAGATVALGTLTWPVWHPGATIAWEIGAPDRTAAKFWHGDDYFKPFLWQQFADEFPNPLEFTIGSNDPRTDWNYVHSRYPPDWSPWLWRINFALDSLPATGNATLTLAVASANSARVDVYVNDEASIVARVYPSGSGGNALVRQGIHAKYSVEYVPIPVALLGVGANTITLIQGRTSSSLPFEHVMYDYVNLELPAGVAGALPVKTRPRQTRYLAPPPNAVPQTRRTVQPRPARP